MNYKKLNGAAGIRSQKNKMDTFMIDSKNKKSKHTKRLPGVTIMKWNMLEWIFTDGVTVNDYIDMIRIDYIIILKMKLSN